jgi:hypothetical protein
MADGKWQWQMADDRWQMANAVVGFMKTEKDLGSLAARARMRRGNR